MGCKGGGRVEGGGDFTQKHYHTNTPFSVGQSERGAFIGPHELRGIRGGEGRSCTTLGFYSLRENSPAFFFFFFPSRNIFTVFVMTFEEVVIQKPTERAQCAGKAMEEVLVSAKDNDSLTVGVYECAKVMNL